MWGGAITDLLQQNDKCQVKVYDSLLYEECYRKSVDFVLGDVRDHQKLSPLLEWADTVVWLAALVGDGACQLNPDLTYAVNQQSVEWLSKNFDGRIIFMSTCSVYGAQDELLDESSPTNPLSIYAATKLEAEKYLQDRNAVMFRLGTLFGVGDIFSRIRMDLVVNVLTAKAMTDKKIHVFGGEQYRPLLHVKDVARAVEQNIFSSNTGVYNLIKENIKIYDLAKIICEVFPECKMETTELPFQDTRNYRVSCDKAIRAFDFNPTHTVMCGINELKDLIANQRIKDVNHIRYSNQKFLEDHFESTGAQ